MCAWYSRTLTLANSAAKILPHLEQSVCHLAEFFFFLVQSRFHYISEIYCTSDHWPSIQPPVKWCGVAGSNRGGSFFLSFPPFRSDTVYVVQYTYLRKKTTTVDLEGREGGRKTTLLFLLPFFSEEEEEKEAEEAEEEEEEEEEGKDITFLHNQTKEQQHSRVLGHEAIRRRKGEPDIRVVFFFLAPKIRPKPDTFPLSFIRIDNLNRFFFNHSIRTCCTLAEKEREIGFHRQLLSAAGSERERESD